MKKQRQNENITTSLPVEIQTNGVVSPIPTDQLEQIVEQAEKQIQLVEKIKNLCIRLTNKNDWILEGEQPYLTLTGATKIRERFGINIKVIDAKKEILTDEKGKYWYVEIKGQAELRGAVIEDVGVATSRDKFFGKEHGRLKDFEEIDVSNIIKKAYTNLQNRLIKKILGFFPTLEDLQKHGIMLDEVKKVEYKEAKLTDEEKQRQKEIVDMLVDITDGDEDEANEILRQASSFEKNGKKVEGVSLKDLEKLRGTRLNITHHKIKELKEQKEKNAKERPLKLVYNLIEEIKKQGTSENAILAYLQLEGNLKITSLADLENLTLDELREVYKLLSREVKKK